MSALIQNLSDFFKLLIESFNLSTTFPALIFVVLVQLFVLPLLPNDLLPRSDEMSIVTTQLSLTIISVGFIAYLLDAANLQIIRLFEGYWFLDAFPSRQLRSYTQKYVSETQADIRKLERLAESLIDQAERERKRVRQLELLDLVDILNARRHALLREIAEKYPEDPSNVLPTPFGNVIAAAEYYSKKTFGMDAIVLWPFLVPTLTKKNYSQYVVREKAAMDFLINLTVLLAAFGCVFAVVELWVNGLDWRVIRNLSLVTLGCLTTYILAIQRAASWGTTVRTAFVLFREDLRQTLRLREVQDYEDERKLWQKASNFFRARRSEAKLLEWGNVIFDAPTSQPSERSKEAKTCWQKIKR
jgi:hypothetical protein